MLSNQAKRLFLSASMPPVELAELRARPDAWQDLYLGFPTQPREVENAICAIVPHLFKHQDLKLAFGGHPAIAPIISDIARRNRDDAVIEIYQSAFFAGCEVFNQRQDGELYKHIQWTPICQPGEAGPQAVTNRFAPGEHPLADDSASSHEHIRAQQQLAQLDAEEQARWREASLTFMRNEMIANSVAGIFVGGMQGISEELRLFEELNPQHTVWLITRPGGRTARIISEAEHNGTIPNHWRIEPELAYETIGNRISEELRLSLKTQMSKATRYHINSKLIHKGSLMNTSEHLNRLRNMVMQVMPKAMIESPASALESFDLSDEQHQGAVSGLESLVRDESINDDQQQALEAIILPKFRPAINIIADTFSNPPAPWQHLGSADIKQRIERVVRSIGRVEVPDHPTAPYAGTGFVVGPNLMMTNRHVAELFASGFGEHQIAFRPGRTAAVDFKREIVPTEPVLLTISQIVMIHPYWDMALLQVSGLSDLNPSLPLSVKHPEDLAEQDIAIIGYPAQDWRNDLDLQNRIFGGVFDVKRLQPGKLKTRRNVESFGHEVDAVTHDASTLGGNSGSAVVDLSTGEVIALHFAGRYLDANFAVPTYELARDNRVVQAGVNFTGSITPTDDWAAIWRLTEEEQESAMGQVKSSAVASQNGNTATLTVPLHISVSLGTQSIDLAPSVSPRGKPAVIDEGLLGRVDPEVIAKSYEKFSIDSLLHDQFHWNAALSAGAASHLIYDAWPAVVTTARNAWDFAACEFIETDNTESFVAKSSTAIIVAFRGTTSISDWLTNLNAFSHKAAYGAVHRGFYFAFHSVKQDLEKFLGDVATSQRVILTGHSLGGALATLAAAEWQGKYPISAVYTYGQPAVGKSDFRTFMTDHYDSKFLRIVNDDDIVPRVPPGYKHVGRLFHFGPGGELQNATTESIPGTPGSETMTDFEFAALQSSLRAKTAQPPTESIGQEGILLSISDHKMDRYLSKILGQAG